MSDRQHYGLPSGPWNERERIAFNLHKIAGRVLSGEYTRPARNLVDPPNVRERMAEAVLAFATSVEARMTDPERDLIAKFLNAEALAFADAVRTGGRKVDGGEGEPGE